LESDSFHIPNNNISLLIHWRFVNGGIYRAGSFNFLFENILTKKFFGPIKHLDWQRVFPSQSLVQAKREKNVEIVVKIDIYFKPIFQ